MNKRYVIMLILFFFVISLGIGLTYSFYTPTIIDNQVSSTTKISNKNIEANYINGSDILIDSSHTSVTKNITIKNNNASTIDYVLNFFDVINTLGDKTKLTYSYTCTGTGCSGRSNMEVPSIDGPLTLLVSIATGITHTYEITLTYDGTPSGSFTSRIESVKPSVLIASTGSTDTRYFWGYKASITSVTFEKGIDIPVGVTASWDVSEDQDGSIMAYIIGSSTYDLYFQTEGDFLILNPNSSFLFYDFTSLTAINNISMLRTYYAINMSYMFGNCTALTTLDVSTFDTSNVTSIDGMFYYCETLTNLNLSSFNTSKVTNMSWMFGGSFNLTSLDVSTFDTSKVTNMSYIFSNCGGLTILDVSTFDTGNVVDMSYMFYGCHSLSNLDVSALDTAKVTDMLCMFYDCTGLISLDVSTFDTSSVTNMQSMFYNCSALTSLDLSTFDTSSVAGMSYMFSDCSSLTSLDVSTFDTSSVTYMNSMFSDCSSLTSLDLSIFDTSKVTNMSAMFYGCSFLTSLDLSTFDTSSVTNMNSMFSSCSSLTSLDFRLADFTTVTTYTNMFTGITSGITITVLDTSAQTFINARLTNAGKTGTVTIA